MRPLLTEAQAARFDRASVLSRVGPAGAERLDPWHPTRDMPCRDAQYDALVDSSRAGHANVFATVQQAVDHCLGMARKTESNDRMFIAVAPGLHEGLVYLPKLAFSRVRFTIFGLGEAPQDTVLHANIDAEMPGDEYANRFERQFGQSDAAVKEIFQRIAARTTLSTANASVLRIEADGTQIYNLTIHNRYNADRNAATPAGLEKNHAGQFAKGQHQAVAFLSAGADKVILGAVHLKSFQDTLYLQAPDKFSTVRSYLFDCDIEGDVDFIFGQSTAYFETSTIRAIGARGAHCWLTAPSTNLRTSFGFVFDRCDLTHDSSDLARRGVFNLGRQWFEAVRASPYGIAPVRGYAVTLCSESRYDPPLGSIAPASLQSVGKCVFLNCRVGDHVNIAAPWDDWSGPGYGPDGQLLPGEWQPRYRPVQTGPKDMARFLSPWAGTEALGLSECPDDDIWLGEYNPTPMLNNT
ncbi:pectinesterase family protein [Pseudoprimorskyibacter insulae]|uniref:pectinesterase family protein n=1 Tax=Pseudoprimorskyibacter insulae TaxID=1695997 RepID=UPI0015E8353F|nr:pectinesterase family protein [Pseudoprimorskyibacter insulae]